MVIVEQLVEWRLVGETEVLGENLPPVPLCLPQIPHDLSRARTRRGGKPGPNRLNHDTAQPAANTWLLITQRDTFTKGINVFCSELLLLLLLSRVWSDYKRGFGLEIGFIDQFTTQLVITLNYSAIADFHTFQIFSSSKFLH
jgi:hypothetical protein